MSGEPLKSLKGSARGLKPASISKDDSTSCATFIALQISDLHSRRHFLYPANRFGAHPPSKTLILWP